MTRTVLLVTICAISSVKSLYPCFTQQYRAGNCDFFCQLKCSNTGTCSHYLGYQVGSCNSNQVFLNGLCYSTSSDFGPCQFSEQCTGAGSLCQKSLCTPYVPPRTECSSNQILRNNICWSFVPHGERCEFNEQCSPTGRCSRTLKICEPMNPQAPRCKQPGQQFEMRSGRVVNCLHEMCSPQFTCEHQLGTEMSICCRNTAFVQRIVTASAPFFHK